MTKQLKLRLTVIVITGCWAMSEWLLFELRRTPYRPPHDMKPLLGVERSMITPVMGCFAVAWAFTLIWICFRANFTGRDYACFGLTIAVLAVLLAAAAIFPLWPVTPYELLWT